jgi:hypothetical protein
LVNPDASTERLSTVSSPFLSMGHTQKGKQ